MRSICTLIVLGTLAGSAGAATLPDTLSGNVKGTTLPNHTYVVKDSLIVNAGDTLRFSAGNTIIMGSPTGWIHVLGTFFCDGTKSSPNLFTVPLPRRTGPGQWGGIVGDSCTYFEMKWTTILWAGGNNTGGHAYRTIDIYSDYQNKTTTVFTDNTCIGTVDDCIGLHGGNASVLRNTIKWCGAPDGDNINVKSGTIGEIAYNVIWSSGGNGIKLNADPNLLRLTNMCVHNNTIVAGGWRRVGELGYGILVDASARAQIYNNIIGDMYQELEITHQADTVRTVYDNNLFFYSADSLKGVARYYPSDGVGKPAPHDILDVQASALFQSYQTYFTNDWFALDGENDYHLLSSAPAVGHGFTPPAAWVNPFFPGVNLPGDPNMGALGVYTFASSKSDTLSGNIKGTLLANHTYVVKDSLIVNAGDTLRFSAGDTVIMASPTGWIHVLGTFFCDGTKTSPNLFTVPPARRTGPGQWGGIVGDSCRYFEMKWTTILWAGGNNTGGHAYRTIDIYSDYQNKTTTVFTDNTCIGTVDDCIGLHGGNASILRNTIKWCGAPDGDNINVKSGTIGEIAYNVIWSSGGNGIKLNADPNLLRLTNMCVHNNTIVAGGWRRVGELGYGILVDASARAQIYNNIIGDMYQELEITHQADTVRTVYDNNLFFYSADSLKGLARYYPSDGVGKPATHDILDVKASALFASYNTYFTNDWFALDGENDYHLLPGAAALGHGFTPPASWVNPYFPGVNLPGDPNMGALGVITLTAVKNQNPGTAATFALMQNYPNPFNPSTTIEFEIPARTNVRLTVYDVLGREVASLYNGVHEAGRYPVVWNASNVASGMYFFRLEADRFTAIRKMLLLK
jgi:hypothetical protein